MKYKWTRKLLAAALTVTLLAGSAGGVAVHAENEAVTEETALEESVSEEMGISAEDELTDSADTGDSVEQTEGEMEASTEELLTEETESRDVKAESEEPASAMAQSTNFDVTKPVVEEIAIDKQGQTIQSTDSITISVKAYDADSGIDKIICGMMSEKDDVKYGHEFSEKYYDAESETYRFTIDCKDFEGKAWIASLDVYDKSGNVQKVNVSTSEYSESCEKDKALYYCIVNAEQQNTELTIQSVECEQNGKTLKPGDTVNVVVMGNGTAIRGYSLSGFQTSLARGNKYDYFSPDSDFIENQDGKSVGIKITWTIPQKVVSGEWTIGSITLREKSTGKEVDVESSQLPKFTIESSIGREETNPSEVSDIIMDAAGKNLTEGQSAKISVKAEDADGIDTVKAYFRNANSNSIAQTAAEKTVELKKNAQTSYYEGSLDLDENTYPGEWYLEDIEIVDQNGWSRPISSFKKDGATTYTDEKYYINAYIKGSYVSKNEKVTFLYWNEETNSFERKTVEVPRRTKGSELSQYFVPEQSANLKFQSWVWSGRYHSDTVLNSWQTVKATYDKSIIQFEIFYTVNAKGGVTLKTVYAKKGDTVPLPKVKGFENPKWYIDDETAPDSDPEAELIGSITDAGYIVGSNPYHYIAADYEVPEGMEELPDFEELIETPSEPETPSQPNGSSDTNGAFQPNGSSDANGSQETSGQGKQPVTLSADVISKKAAEIQTAAEKQQITISMGAATVVPKEILEAAKGKDIDLILQMNGYTWKINGKNVLSSNLKDINLEVTKNTNAIPGSVISSLAGNNPVEQLSLTYSGDFGFKADLTYNIGSQYTGKYGNLYYYDSDGRMIFMNAGAIDESGNVTLSFSHASEYAVVITDKPMSAKTTVSDTKKNTVQKTSPETGDNNLGAGWLFVILCAGGLFAEAAYRKKKQIR